MPDGVDPILGHSMFSGFIVEQDFIVTITHGACDWYFHDDINIRGFRLRSLEVTDIGGDKLPECLIVNTVAIDTGANLALLHLPDGLHPKFAFQLAAERDVQAGQSVYTIGDSYDYPWSMKFGRVSHTRRTGNLP